MGKKSTEDPFYKELGKELKNAREAKGLTPSQAAIQIGHSHSNAIGRYENATRTPDIKTLSALTSAYQIDLNSVTMKAAAAAQAVNQNKWEQGNGEKNKIE